MLQQPSNPLDIEKKQKQKSLKKDLGHNPIEVNSPIQLVVYSLKENNFDSNLPIIFLQSKLKHFIH
jgi:hypothetical protein